MVLELQTGKVWLAALPGLCARGSRDALAPLVGGLVPSTCGHRVEAIPVCPFHTCPMLVTSQHRQADVEGQAGDALNGPSYIVYSPAGKSPWG